MSKDDEKDDVDILDIDRKICQNFRNEKNRLQEYNEKLENLRNSLKLNNIRDGIRENLIQCEKDLETYIDDLINDVSVNYYTIESAALLEEYKRILNAPVKVSFVGKSVKNNKQKQNLINTYLEIAGKYVNININPEAKVYKIVCKNCRVCKDFDIVDENIHICTNCSAQEIIVKNISSYKDIDRINISSKYLYDRKVHFRDNINQYQGKQNVTIHQQVYDDLERQFELHHLLLDESQCKDKKDRFRNITKEHVYMFLKELDYTKHYENATMIHYNMTGIKPDDIGHLEERLLEDFDLLTETYDKIFKNIDRKNFINTSFVLFLLLSKYKHPCKKEDFSGLFN